jgi:hypothetical protein
MVRWRDLSADAEQIRLCPVHPGKSAFLPVKRNAGGKCRSLDASG